MPRSQTLENHVTTYTIEINEYQRRMFIAALEDRADLHGPTLHTLPGDAEPTAFEEIVLTIQMLEELPETTAREPDLISGFCY